ncbi:MAG: transporter substrate-binding domain-containing protein [Chlorobium sp.]|nr:transporter substrate-binding domain-containing protein [Chlorobium sp.]
MAAELRVGVREVQPFIFLQDGQEPRGYSIDLWKAIAAELHLDYRFLPSQGITQTLQDMEAGKLDLAIGAITITEAREKLFDFSHSYFHTGLGIMIPTSSSYSLSALLYSFFSRDRLITIGLFLLFAAHLIWLAERRQPQSFDSSYSRGIFQGIYWAVVTAATVGYGDFTPKSPVGKLISILIIIVSLPLMAVFIASFSSDITLHELRSFIEGSQDLAGKKVGVVKGSTSDEYLQRANLGILERTTNLQELFKRFEQGSFDAAVHDEPALHYYASTTGIGKVKVASTLFDKQNYAILYQDDSELKEPIDRILLRLSENGKLAELYTKWFNEFERDAIGAPSHGPSHN